MKDFKIQDCDTILSVLLPMGLNEKGSFPICIYPLPYSTKFWQGNTLAN